MNIKRLHDSFVMRSILAVTKYYKVMDGEKIICYDRGNDNALAYAMANKNNDPMAMAAMMNGGMNGWQNNPLN